MAGKQEILEVDGQTYRVTALDTTPALELYDELRLALGDVIRRAAEPGGTEEQIMVRVAAGAIGGLPKGTPQNLTKVFAPRTEVRLATEGAVTEVWVPLEGKLLDGWFADPRGGRGVGHWQKWIRACLEFQFADFLSAFVSSTPSEKSGATSGAAAPTK